MYYPLGVLISNMRCAFTKVQSIIFLIIHYKILNIDLLVNSVATRHMQSVFESWVLQIPILAYLLLCHTHAFVQVWASVSRV